MTTATIAPTEEMPCTISIGSDRYAAKVIKILSPKRIMIEYQYILDRDPNSEGKPWSQRKGGEWRPKGDPRRGGYHLRLGEAEDYRDPSY